MDEIDGQTEFYSFSVSGWSRSVYRKAEMLRRFHDSAKNNGTGGRILLKSFLLRWTKGFTVGVKRL